MSKLFRELIGQLSPERRKSIEARAQTILHGMAFRYCCESDTLVGLSEHEIDQITVARTNNDTAQDVESFEWM